MRIISDCNVYYRLYIRKAIAIDNRLILYGILMQSSAWRKHSRVKVGSRGSGAMKTLCRRQCGFCGSKRSCICILIHTSRVCNSVSRHHTALTSDTNYSPPLQAPIDVRGVCIISLPRFPKLYGNSRRRDTRPPGGLDFVSLV